MLDTIDRISNRNITVRRVLILCTIDCTEFAKMVDFLGYNSRELEDVYLNYCNSEIELFKIYIFQMTIDKTMMLLSEASQMRLNSQSERAAKAELLNALSQEFCPKCKKELECIDFSAHVYRCDECSIMFEKDHEQWTQI